MTFRVGQKVVCVLECLPQPGKTAPVKGAVYTVRDILEWHGCLGVRLQEIHNDPWDTDIGFIELGFRIEQFRPFIDRESNMSTFAGMLKQNELIGQK